MSSRNLKNTLVSIPIFGYLVRIASNIYNLPRFHDHLNNSQHRVNNSLDQLQEKIDKLIAQTAEHNKEIKDILRAQDDLQGQFSLFETSNNKKSKTKSLSNKQLFADDHIMDIFYASFEDRFRGNEATISKRLEVYLPYFKDSKLEFDKTPVLDIGSGRGEFLQLLKNNKISAMGLDINHDMVDRSNKKSLKAVQGDALTFLQTAKSQSYGAITGFHIVEHIPFNSLLRILKGCYRALTKNGFVIFETPNPENLIVGSTNFYMDPSHLNPLPPKLMSFALEICGFKNIEIKRLHPETELKIRGLDPQVIKLLSGPRDYSVIGYK